jgi:CDP-diacylglycerol--glycerol-3-phosphate 3-phosphatidyltransferase
MPHRHELDIPAVPGLWPLTWPMGLTMLRLLLLPVFLWLILASPPDAGPRQFRWAAIGVFAVMALTDKLDGYLARRLNQTSRLGTILDPIADKLLVASSVVLLSFDWIASEPYRIPTTVVAIIYGGYLVVATGTLALLLVVGRVSIAARPLGKANTVLQLALVLLTLIAPELHERAGWLRTVLKALWWIVPAVAIATSADYVVLGIRQFRDFRRDRPGESEVASAP